MTPAGSDRTTRRAGRGDRSQGLAGRASRGSGGRLRSPARWAGATVVGSLLLILQVNRHGNLRLGFFYDEMWRVVFVRSPAPVSLMLGHDTPIPPGWVFVGHLVSLMVPYRTEVYRLAALVPLALAAGVTALVLRKVLNASAPAAVWIGSPLLLSAVPVVAGQYYLTNYPVEILHLCLLALAAVYLEDSPVWRGHSLALLALSALLAVAPFVTIGGLLAVPGFFIWGGWWSWNRPETSEKRAALTIVAAGAVVSCMSAVTIYLVLYRRVAEQSGVGDWWTARGTTIGGRLSLWDLAVKVTVQLRDGLLPERVTATGMPIILLFTLLLIASFITGVVVIGRRSLGLLLVPLSAQALTIPADLLVRWPLTIERVNLCFQWLGLVAATTGFLWLLTMPLRRLPIAAIAAAAICVVLTVPAPMRNDPHDFARGLPTDLEIIANSPAPRNVVIGYHWMSWPYLYDVLMLDADRDGRFEVVRDSERDRGLYQVGAVEQLVDDRRLGVGDRVWCVKPIHLADEFAAACRIAPASHLREVARQVSADSTIIGYEVTEPVT